MLPLKSPCNLMFIVGVQRSGTTLTRNILTAHPNITVPYECAFYKLLATKYEENDAIETNLEEFIKDLLAVKRFEFWNLDKNELSAFLSSHGQHINYARMIKLIIEAYKKKTKPNASIIGIKNPNGIYHLPFIFNHWPEARIIHVIRDVRGIYASEKKKNKKIGSYNSSEYLWKVSRRYKSMVDAYLRSKNDQRVLHIKYENIIGNLKESSELICDWLGINWSERMMSYDKIGQANNFVPAREMWQHNLSISKPNKNRIDAYKSELSPKELKSIELLMKNELQKFGYVANLDQSHYKYGMITIMAYLKGAYITARDKYLSAM